jgi:hypothetical protein
MIWNELIKLQQELEKLFDNHFERYQEENLDKFNSPGWINITWKSPKFRRVHIDVVDARETKKLWMMHVCIFPNLQSGAPIYGFDIISGANKITGAFHDFSPVNLNDPALEFFSNAVAKYKWSKDRVLPDWAKAIFSDNMVAAGNIQSIEEVENLISLVLFTTKWYITNMDVQNDTDSSIAHNKYAFYQKQNPHTPRTMKALGLNDKDVDFFVEKCLFPTV